MTFLNWSLKQKHIDSITPYLDESIKLSDEKITADIANMKNAEFTLLHISLVANQLNRAKQLIELGHDLNCVNKDNLSHNGINCFVELTPLMFIFSTNKSFELAKLIIEKDPTTLFFKTANSNIAYKYFFENLQYSYYNYYSYIFNRVVYLNNFDLNELPVLTKRGIDEQAVVDFIKYIAKQSNFNIYDLSKYIYNLVDNYDSRNDRNRYYNLIHAEIKNIIKTHFEKTRQFINWNNFEEPDEYYSPFGDDTYGMEKYYTDYCKKLNCEKYLMMVQNKITQEYLNIIK